MHQYRHVISVIIPTFNRDNFIVDAVESVLKQGIDNLEIIVIDDGSTDNTRHVLKPYMNAIRYIYQENRGVSAARNRGVIESQGKLIAFLDSDDIWLENKLRVQIDIASSGDVMSFEGVGWFTDQEENRALLKESEHVKWPRCDPNGYVKDPILDVASGCYFHLGTLLCRKSAFMKIGFFDERLCMGEDEDWFSRASLLMPFHYIPQPLLRRRFHHNQISRESEEGLRSLINVFTNMKFRTHNVHEKAYAISISRLADKWSHLANCLAHQGRNIESARASWTAFRLKPSKVQRVVKAGLMLLGWAPQESADRECGIYQA